MKILFALVLVGSLAAWARTPLPTYPRAVHTRIGADLQVTGEQYRLAYFVTPDDLKKVGRHFLKTFRDDGFPVTVEGDFVEAGTVSAFHTREGVIRSVVLRRYEGKTVGLSVLKDAWGYEPPSAGSTWRGVEGALLEEVGSMTHAGNGQRSIVLDASCEEGMTRVLKSLADEGFQQTSERRAKGQSLVFEHHRAGVRVVTSVAAVDAKLCGVHQVRMEP